MLDIRCNASQTDRKFLLETLITPIQDKKYVMVVARHQGFHTKKWAREFFQAHPFQLKRVGFLHGKRHTFYFWNVLETEDPGVVVYYEPLPETLAEPENLQYLDVRVYLYSPPKPWIEAYGKPTWVRKPRDIDVVRLQTARQSRTLFEAVQAQPHDAFLLGDPAFKDHPTLSPEQESWVRRLGSRQNLKDKDRALYRFLLKWGRKDLERLLPVTPRENWTEETALKAALGFKSKHLFRLQHHGAFKYLFKIGKMPRFERTRGSWTVERALDLRKTCRNRRDFQIKYSGAYEFLKRKQVNF